MCSSIWHFLLKFKFNFFFNLKPLDCQNAASMAPGFKGKHLKFEIDKLINKFTNHINLICRFIH